MCVEDSAGRTISTGSEDGTVDATDSGGLGIGGTQRVRDAAHRGSWADCLEMIKVRHPNVATKVVRGFSQALSQCCKAVRDAVSRLQAVGLKTPSWEALAAGLRPEEVRRVRQRDRDPTEPRHGWQKSRVIGGAQTTPRSVCVATVV